VGIVSQTEFSKSVKVFMRSRFFWEKNIIRLLNEKPLLWVENCYPEMSVSNLKNVEFGNS